jgi:hypothetical protein
VAVNGSNLPLDCIIQHLPFFATEIYPLSIEAPDPKLAKILAILGKILRVAAKPSQRFATRFTFSV